VPSNNRLLDAYLPAQRLAELNKGTGAGRLEVYAMLEVSRRGEYADCTPEAFQQVLASIGPTMGTFNKTSMDELEQEMNSHLKSPGTKPVELGRPEMLGGIFQKSNAAGFAMSTAIKQDDRSVSMATGVALIRVRQRLIFAYLYSQFDSPESLTWLRKNLEAWCDAILAKNQ
jgi:hypothetical protein